MKAVRVSDLYYTYDDGTQALNGVDFELDDGASVALLGRNGSGKTTFALHLNGILRGKGEIEIDGLPVNEANLTEIRRRVGFVFQDSDHQLFMPSVIEDAAFGPLAAGVPPREAKARAEEALDRVGMLHQAGKAPWLLSAGEKKRVAIAGILAGDPKLLVLDEPTTSLDPPGRRELVFLLRSLTQAKILITHDTQFASMLTDQAVFFEQGRIAARGSLAEIVERFDW